MEKFSVTLFNKVDCIFEESLGIERMCIEIERQDRFIEHCIEPKCFFIVVHYFKNPDQNLRLALVVHIRAITFVVGDYDLAELVLHQFL